MANNVTFYHMDGCGHCVEFNRKWETVTDQLKIWVMKLVKSKLIHKKPGML